MRRVLSKVLGLKLNFEFGDMWAEFDAPDGKTIVLDPDGNMVMLHRMAAWRKEGGG